MNACDNCGDYRSPHRGWSTDWDGREYCPSCVRLKAHGPDALFYFRRWFVRLRLPLLLLAVGFLAAWEAQSRWWLGRIPQPDDAVCVLGTSSRIEWPTTQSPIGTAVVCSCSWYGYWDGRGDPTGVAPVITCDGFAPCGTAIFTYIGGRWVEWRRQP